jgi:CRISPR-associated protein Cmr6
MLHPGLVFYRFMKIESSDSKSKFLPSLKNMAKTAVPFYSILKTRLKDQHAALKSTGVWEVKHFEATLTTRMAIGLGIPNQSENGITLDQTHGMPLIPGSTIKGITQDYILSIDPDKKKYRCFSVMFGKDSSDDDNDERKGSVIFFDAILDSQAPPFDIDIMNPHFGEYYSGSGSVPPADYLKPNPIFFLTIKEGTKFYFSVAAKNVVIRDTDDFNYVLYKQTANDLALSAAQIMQNALSELGVGAKTRTGYGRFECGGIS